MPETDRWKEVLAYESDSTVHTLASVAPERITWLWPGRVPLGKLVVIDGDPSTGKSTLSLDLGARVSAGLSWPDGAPGPEPAGVLLLSAEDGLADTIVPRLTAAGADLARVHALTEVALVGLDGARQMVPPSLPRDIPVIEQQVRKYNVRLVVIDVLMAYLAGAVDSHRDQDVRAVLHRLAAMAEATGCTVVLIRHMNKAGGSNALYRGGGSIGIIGAARAAFLVARDPDDTDRRIFAVTKMDIGVEPPALAYRLQSDESLDCARVVWESDPVTLTAADLLRAPLESEERTERDDAADWLRDRLSDTGGTAPSKEIKDAARKAGHQVRTLQRARDQLGIVVESSGFPRISYWSLPDAAVVPVVPPVPDTLRVAQLGGRGTTGAGAHSMPLLPSVGQHAARAHCGRPCVPTLRTRHPRRNQLLGLRIPQEPDQGWPMRSVQRPSIEAGCGVTTAPKLEHTARCAQPELRPSADPLDHTRTRWRCPDCGRTTVVTTGIPARHVGRLGTGMDA